MQDRKYIELILKEIDGDLTAAEKRSLSQWLNSAEIHQQQAAQIREMVQLTGSYEPRIELDIDADYQALVKKIRFSRKQRSLRRMRVLFMAASVAVLLATIWFLAINDSSAPDMVVLTGPEAASELPDGSLTWLAEASRLSFMEDEEGRLVKLEGLAYFEVKSNAGFPFAIETDLGRVRVVGTEFEVRANAGEPLEVKVSHGVVLIENIQGTQSQQLNAGQAGTVSSAGVIQLTEVNYPLASWRLPEKTFDRQPLQRLLEEMERQYNIKISAQDQQVRECVITFTLTYPTLEVLIASLETLLDMKFQPLGDGQYLIHGKGCN